MRLDGKQGDGGMAEGMENQREGTLLDGKKRLPAKRLGQRKSDALCAAAPR